MIEKMSARILKAVIYGLAGYFVLFQFEWLWTVIQSVLYSEPSNVKLNFYLTVSLIEFFNEAPLRIIDLLWIAGKSVIIVFMVWFAWITTED